MSVRLYIKNRDFDVICNRDSGLLRIGEVIPEIYGRLVFAETYRMHFLYDVKDSSQESYRDAVEKRELDVKQITRISEVCADIENFPVYESVDSNGNREKFKRDGKIPFLELVFESEIDIS